MSTARTHWILAFVLATLPALLLSSVAPRALAQADQSPNQLRQENERLRQRVAELDAKLAESEKRAARLEEQVRVLQRRLSQPQNAPGGGPGPATGNQPDAPAPPAAPLPDDPFAAPDAMLADLIKDYENTLGAKPRETDREIERYIQDVRRWARVAGAQRRKSVDWMVRVKSVTPLEGRDSEATIQVYDPMTQRPIGDPFVITLAARDATRVEATPKVELWSISGVFSAEPTVNPERQTPGVFNTPKFIGPFAEFGYTFSLRSIRPAGEPNGPGAPSN